MKWLRSGGLCLALIAHGGAVYGAPAAPSPQFGEIAACLKSNLRPAELGLPAAGLRRALVRLGKKSGLFELSNRMGDMSLQRVQGPDREWVTEVRDARGDEFGEGAASFWLGTRGGRTAVSLISGGERGDGIGSMHGEWRRSGPSLIGTGFDEVYHSPNWGGGEFFVFRETSSGLRPVQNVQIDFAAYPFGFENPNSLTVLCGFQAQALSFHTLRGARFHPIEATRWTFHNGRYRKGSTFLVHDSGLAADRLFTAVRQGDARVVNAMIPDAHKRRATLALLKEALKNDATRASYGEGNTIEVDSETGWDGLLTLNLAKRKTGWILRSAEIRRD